jgi:ATP-dependent metalloprotease
LDSYGRFLRSLNDSNSYRQVIREVQKSPQDQSRHLSNNSFQEYVKALVSSGEIYKIPDLRSHLFTISENIPMNHPVPSYPSSFDYKTEPSRDISASQGQLSEPISVKLVTETPSVASSFFLKLFKYGLTSLFLISTGSLLLEAIVAPTKSAVEQAMSNTNNAFQSQYEPLVVLPDIASPSSEAFTELLAMAPIKKELQVVLKSLTDPESFTRLGAVPPRGILLSGLPGCGKTLIAKSIAKSASVPLVICSGSEFDEMYVGVGAARIRAVFKKLREIAKERGSCILFIDEIDALGVKRGARDSNNRMTLNQLLIELDGVNSATTNDDDSDAGRLLVIMATNHASSLDRALLRAGRVDKTIHVSVPDQEGRIEILEYYGSRVKLRDQVDLKSIAKMTTGFTGADLKNLVNTAALIAASSGEAEVSSSHIESAYDRITLGVERAIKMSPEDLKETAVHEAGHAIIGLTLPSADPVQKATILPRGEALGVTFSAPDRDRVSQKLSELEAKLAVALGGKIAEELVFGAENVSGGCASDLRQATHIARTMVMKYGMTGDGEMKPNLLFLDEDEYGNLSETIKTQIDLAVEKLLHASYSNAKEIVIKKRTELELLADGLLEFETLSRAEIDLAVLGKFEEIRFSREKKLTAEKVDGDRNAQSGQQPNKHSSKFPQNIVL